MQHIPHIYDCLEILYGVSVVHLLLVHDVHVLLMHDVHLPPVESN
jgi:hypothetical protein